MDIKINHVDSCQKRFALFVEGEFLRYLPKIFFGWRTFKLVSTTAKDLAAELAQLEYRGVKRFVLRRLTAKSYHSRELKAALQEKGAALDIAEKVVAEFEQLGYLNDTEWLEGFLRRMQREKKGSQYIVSKLKAKCIPDDEIDSVRLKLKDKEAESIQHLLVTRYRQKDLNIPKERQKVIASLARKGFTLGNILKALAEK